jgi:eukaryotic-like serine/threonine-protein kinase
VDPALPSLSPAPAAPVAPAGAAPAILPPGTRLDRYQIIRRLQKGGMAELYLARQLAEGGYEKIVAVKRVLPHLAEDRTFVEMFLNEARLAAGLSHGNIAQVLDFGSEGDEHYLVLEYVHGRSVLELLRQAGKQGGLPLSCALTIVHEVAAALHYAHDKTGSDGRPLGLVHRDVSPSNVLVSYDGEVKLVDFGIAKATAHTRATKSGTIKGKLAYMAPEQVRGEAIDRRADVFSLAVVAYELCTGRRCFVAPGEFALINRVAAGRYERPSSVRPGFPAALEAIIVRGLAVEPEERFTSARELQLAIEELAEVEGHRLSKVALSDTMHALFGHVAYPTAEALPAVGSSAAAVAPTAGPLVASASSPAAPLVADEPEPTPSRRGRATVIVAASTLVLGVALGIGLPRLFADEGRAPAGEAAWADDAPAAPSPGSAPARPNAPAATPADAPAPSAPAAAVAPPPDSADPEAEAAPAPGDDPPSTTARRKPSTKGKRRKAATASSNPPAAHEYLPPSRRSG